MLLCDVTREEASVIIHDLKELEIHKHGSISLEYIDTQISDAAERAVERSPGLASDAVIWEDVENRSQEMTELSFTFVGFMVLAMLIAAVGILIDQPILIVGAMVVGPEFGPVAGLCVALVEKRGALVKRSLSALGVGFAVGILVTVAVTVAFEATDRIPEGFEPTDHPLTSFIANPDFFSFFVAYVAGIAGVLALTSAKSGALVGVLISVTTIPAAANVGVAGALGEWGEAGGAVLQLVVNLVGDRAGRGDHAVPAAALLRGAAHQAPARPGAAGRGLPVGHSARGRPVRDRHPKPDPPPRRRRGYSDDQTSILVRTRPMTSSVNPLLEACPPRSGVRTPAATASSTAS